MLCALSNTCVTMCVLVAAVIGCCVWLAVDYSCGADGFVLSDWPDHAWRLHIPRFPSFSCLLMPLAPCIHKHWHVYASRVQCVFGTIVSRVCYACFVCLLLLFGARPVVCLELCLCFWYLSKLVSCCFEGFTSSFDSAYQAFYSMAIMAEAVHNPIVSMSDWILYARLLSWLLIGLDAFARSLFLSRFSVRSAGSGCLVRLPGAAVWCGAGAATWCSRLTRCLVWCWCVWCGAGVVLVRLSGAVQLPVAVLLHVSTSFVQLCKAQCCGGKSRFWALR